MITTSQQTTAWPTQQAEVRPRPSLPAETTDDIEGSSVDVGTFIMWTLTLAVGIIGLVFPYSSPEPVVKELPAVQAELVQVELTTDPSPPIDAQTPVPTPSQPPEMVQPVIAPEAPALVEVAEPSAAIAFALPTTRQVTVTEGTRHGSAEAASQASVAHTSAPQILTFGEGEGKQPAPDYPQQARREGQQGVVTVRFSIDENGRVLSATAVAKTPWSLLNESAVRVVRERWRFRPGPIRLCEVAIRFQLK